MSPELQAAESILRRGVQYKVPAPLFLRLVGIKSVKILITQLYYGTELRIAAILESKGITEDKIKTAEPHKLMLDHYRDILRIVALASLNKRVINPLSLWLREYYLSRLTVWQLYELYTMIRQYSGAGHFMNITRLAVRTRVTAPNLGQVKGS